jgi:hypothetical protein
MNRGADATASPMRASTDTGWVRLLSRALGLLVVALLMLVLQRAGRELLAEGERLGLGLAEENLRNLVWLEGRRVLAEEGVAGLERRAGGDPRAWARARLAAARPGDVPAVEPLWAESRWRFDAARGELVYHSRWLDEGDHRWRVELRDDRGKPAAPGQGRDLQLVAVATAGGRM